MISALNPLCESSCPPLNPIENNKYNEINLLLEAGISKSLFSLVAITPNKKNRRVGLLKLLMSMLNSMLVQGVVVNGVAIMGRKSFHLEKFHSQINK